jgi:ketose-bisphosphate aldolase
MTLASLTQLLDAARQGGYALGYFEAWDQHSLEATLEAAEEAYAPAILGFGAAVTSQEWLDRGGVEEMAWLARRLAEQARVPAAVLFNEARTLRQIQRGLDAGCNAVMLDTSDLPFDENARLTQQVVNLAHGYDAAVEAELGHLADAVDPLSAGTYTDPGQAATFVDLTGVNALAVSIGNVHLVRRDVVAVDLARLAAIHQAVDVPLVIHGGSGYPPPAIGQAIAYGVAKFNIGTRLKFTFLAGLEAALPPLDQVADIHPLVGSRGERDIMRSAMAGVKRDIVQLMRLYSSAGRAATAPTSRPEPAQAG